jgi:hypothetical protein
MERLFSSLIRLCAARCGTAGTIGRSRSCKNFTVTGSSSGLGSKFNPELHFTCTECRAESGPPAALAGGIVVVMYRTSQQVLVLALALLIIRRWGDSHRVQLRRQLASDSAPLYPELLRPSQT